MLTKPDARRPVPSGLFRANVRADVGGGDVQVDRDGGKFGGGILRGVSLISYGEAQGHYSWIDETTLSQVERLGRRLKAGVKSRFTHPSLSADGTGRYLGRIRELRTDAGRVLGDLSFARTAHKTPDGNLAEYVTNLALEDSAAAGLSIVFDHDSDAELAFLLEHGATESGGYVDLSKFESPDPENVNNYPHVRLARLRAADFVDDPAANESGLFDQQPLARNASAFLCYAAGITDNAPTESAFDVDPDRARQFLTRWLSANDLTLLPTSELNEMSNDTAPAPTTSDEPNTNPAQPAESTATTRAEFAAELKRFTDRFGIENGTQWFNDGVSYGDAIEKHCDALAEQVSQLTTERDAAVEKLSSVEIGEVEPANVAAETGAKKPFRKFFNNVPNAPASSN